MNIQMIQSRCASLTGLVLVLAALAAPAPQAVAQCGPDGFTGFCCTPVTPTLPFFPNAQLPGSNICWTGCQPANQIGVTVDWTAPVQVSCTEYVSQLTVTSSSSIPILIGKMVLDYTRTWDELDPNGRTHQVWRFVVKADLSNPTPTAWNCEAPKCLAPTGPYNTAFYYGYMDYASDCAVGSLFENTLVLYHAADFFIHKPLLSDKPGTFHPNRSYAIVAPHSTAQPFVPKNQLAPSGPFFGEAMRDMGSIAPPICFDEDYISGGQSTAIAQLCLNTLSLGKKHHTVRIFQGTGSCISSTGLPGNFQSLKVGFPTLPWFHLVSASIGNWTNPNVYPGVESAWADEGIFIHRTACAGDYIDINYGATTKDGWFIIHPVLLTNMTDLADNYTTFLSSPISFPVLGSVRPTEKLIYTFSP